MLTIVIPMFNEEKAIEKLFEEIDFFTKNSQALVEVIFINDCSSDETLKIVQSNLQIRTKSKKRNAKFQLLNNPVNLGYGASLKRGIQAATFDLCAIIDADLTYSFTDLLNCFQVLLNHGFDMVVGARSGKFYEGNLTKKTLRKILGKIVAYMSGQPIQDINSGLRVFRKDYVVDHLGLLSNRFSFTTSLTLLVMLSGGIVRYEPIEYKKRSGDSNVRLATDSVRTLGLVLAVSYFYNPLRIIYPLLLSSGLITVFTGLTAIVMKSSTILVCAYISGASTTVLFAIGFFSQLMSLQRQVGERS